MRITELKTHLLYVPTSPPRASPEEERAGRLNHIVTLIVELETDGGLTGLGMAYALQGSGRGLQAVAEDDLAPLVVGENPLDHERLAAKFYWRMQTVGRRGLVQQAWSAIDVALWDLKGKVAGLPLHKLLGGAREATPIYGSDTGWLWMTPEEIIEASIPYLKQGMTGIKVKVGKNPEEDADRLQRVREALGEEIWLGVDANQRYDYATALAIGYFFEEEIGADWFEEPILCEDVAGHARLVSKLDIPIAAGEMLFGRDEFERYLETDAIQILQPDITRLGGITGTLKVIALAEQHSRHVAPHLQPEIAVQLACGLPSVTLVEYMPWFFPLFTNPPEVAEGRLLPPPGPGLGLELHKDHVSKYKVG